jgi:hypothetical protein
MLIVLSPVAALLWVLPQTQGWFRWSADLFPITVFQQAIQVMVPQPRHGADGGAPARQPLQRLLTLMLGIAVCWLTLKVPSLLRSRHSQAGLWNVVTLVAASRAGRRGDMRSKGTQLTPPGARARAAARSASRAFRNNEATGWR